MTIVLIILGVLVGLIALALIAALFLPKDYEIWREIVIEKPVAQVYDYARNIKNQDHFSKWVMTDPNMQKFYKGTDGTVGFVYGWNGNKQAGEGEQEIVGLVPNKRIDIEVRFIRPFASTAKTPMAFEEMGERRTKVRWGMQSSMKYPFNLMFSLFGLQKVLTKDLDTSLGNLKRILEG
jgi:hypothetical protein